MLLRWYVLAIIVYSVFWVVWVLSGSSAFNMVTNMIAGLSVLIALIFVIEVLKRKTKPSV